MLQLLFYMNYEYFEFTVTTLQWLVIKLPLLNAVYKAHHCKG